MHDVRVGRFFAIDPLTSKYPWYTPYSFSGNKVIAFRELEGMEETWAGFLGVNLGEPLLKKTMWYDLHRKMAAANPTKTFWSSAIENTRKNNAHFYPLVRHVNAYYEWADAYSKSKGLDLKWIESARKVTSKFEVGLIEYDPTVIPGLSVSMATKNFIIGTGEYLLKNFSMPLMKEIIEKGTVNGQKKGSQSLDMDLLIGEQTILQNRLEITQAKNKEAFNKIMGEYNEGFDVFMAIKDDNHYLNLSSEILGRGIQFQNLQDRLVMGMVLLYQGYGIEINDKTKKEILDKSAKEDKLYVPILPPQ
jgi:hypothetical protein